MQFKSELLFTLRAGVGDGTQNKNKVRGEGGWGQEKWVKRSTIWWWMVRLEVTTLVYTNVQLQ